MFRRATRGEVDKATSKMKPTRSTQRILSATYLPTALAER
jgi:hypothetical protein